MMKAAMPTGESMSAAAMVSGRVPMIAPCPRIHRGEPSAGRPADVTAEGEVPLVAEGLGHEDVETFGDGRTSHRTVDELGVQVARQRRDDHVNVEQVGQRQQLEEGARPEEFT